MLDTKEHGVHTGFRYDSFGRPVDGCPWGDVEEVSVDEVILGIEYVAPGEAINHTLREQRRAEFAEAAERDNANNPLWGMF